MGDAIHQHMLRHGAGCAPINYGVGYLEHAPGQTSRQVSVTLGAAAGDIGHMLILRVTDYAGWHSRDIWQWISARLELPSASPEPPDTDRDPAV
jgi:hypothetical protein